MLPTFRPGDRLLIDPRPPRPLVPGDVVALRDPEREGRWLLKRVVDLGPDGSTEALRTAPGTVYVVGDNAGPSRDSRHFGAVPRDRILGLAWYRYFPTDRRGRIDAR